jgi:hypothetical protein
VHPGETVAQRNNILDNPIDFPFCGFAQEPRPSHAAPPPEPAILAQEHMTGEWTGTRSRLKEESGVDMEFSFTQFVQGVTSGGADRGAVGNGKFQTEFKFDLGKLLGWKFWLAEVKTETRFGGPLLPGTGAINPVNTAAIVPAAAGNVFISAVNITKLVPINLQKGDMLASQSDDLTTWSSSRRTSLRAVE